MINEKLKSLADLIVGYSLKVAKDEKVLISCQSTKSLPLVNYLIDAICLAAGIPYVNISDLELNTILLEKTTNKRINLLTEVAKFEVDTYDSFINIRHALNDYENKNINDTILKEMGNKLRPIMNVKINNRKWVLLNYPSDLDAYKAKMKIKEFYYFAFEVMTVDYHQLSIDVIPLVKLMEKTDKVQITGPGTNLTFSIKDIPVIPCVGQRNLPDGEVFTAPVKDSVNGYITYNTPSPYRGEIFNEVKFIFKAGKIVKAQCRGSDEKLNHILDTDLGSRYLGEFAFGLNPLIRRPMGDTLYDEKIIGSIHLTPGNSYAEAFNGNESSIHWDMILIQRKDYGGGNIYFDDILIREDGLFVIDELKHLNYDLDSLSEN